MVENTLEYAVILEVRVYFVHLYHFYYQIFSIKQTPLNCKPFNDCYQYIMK